MKSGKYLLRLPVLLVALTMLGCEQPIGGRYTDNKNGTITDNQTGLTWYRCLVGQRWSANTCEGEPILMNRADAKRAAEGFVYAGITEWRLPSAQESHAIIFCSNDTKTPFISGQQFKYCKDTDEERFESPTIDSSIFPNAIVSPKETDNENVFNLVTWTSDLASKNIMGVDIRSYSWTTTWISGEIAILSNNQKMSLLLVSDINKKAP